MWWDYSTSPQTTHSIGSPTNYPSAISPQDEWLLCSRKRIWLRRHNKSIYIVFRHDIRFIDQVQSALNLAHTVELKYKVPFHCSQKIDNASDIDWSAFIRNASMLNFHRYIRISRLLEKNDVFALVKLQIMRTKQRNGKNCLGLVHPYDETIFTATGKLEKTIVMAADKQINYTFFPSSFRA